MSNAAIDPPAAVGGLDQPGPTPLSYAGPALVPVRGIYYGWACVIAAALAMVATLPGRTMGLGLVTEPLLHDLAISRPLYSTINLWATLIGAGFGLGAGRLLDRFGVRAVTAAIVLILGLVVCGMARLAGPWGLFISVTLTRGLGQSALSVASIAIVGKWFERRSGLAMGVYSIILSVGFMAAIPALEAASHFAGWRKAWGGMGLILAAGVAPLLWAMVRNGPEALGLRVDGGRGAPEARGTPSGYTLNGALATSAFWALALGGFLFNTAYSGITLFSASILAERGYHGPISGPLMVMVFTALPTNFLAGWLASRVSMTRMMAAAMFLLSASLLALPLVETFPQIVAFAAVMGISAGVVTVVFFACWGRLYGRLHLGKIQGAAQALTVLASAAGPMILTGCQARTGSYAAAFYICAALSAAFGILCFAVGDPAPRREIARLGSIDPPATAE